MFKKFFATITLSAALLAGGLTGTAQAVKTPGVTYAYSQNLTATNIQNRGESLLIECCYGTVRNKRGDGKITNAATGMSGYISYRPLVKAGVLRKGDSVRTLLFYDIGGNSVDGIFGRVDYRIRAGKSKLISVDFDRVNKIYR